MKGIIFKQVDFLYHEENVLNQIDVVIEKNSFTLIVGPNGAGKSTLLKLASGLLLPTRGQITIDGDSVLDSQRAGKLYLVPQIYNKNAAQFPATVEEVVRLSMRTKREDLKNESIAPTVSEVLNLVGMADFANRRIGDLSGGQQQRVMLAQALVRRPAYLFLDEPTSGIDFQTSQEIYRLLKRIQKDTDMTIVLVSHDIHEAAKEASAVLCINRHVCYQGSCDGFLHSHMHTGLAWHIGG